MLNADLVEEKEDAKTNSINNNVSPFQVPNIQSQIAGLSAYSDAAYNLKIAKEEAGLGVYLKNDANSHTIFIQAFAKNISSVLQAEALGLTLAAMEVKTLG